jgi:hypothetical protein
MNEPETEQLTTGYNVTIQLLDDTVTSYGGDTLQQACQQAYNLMQEKFAQCEKLVLAIIKTFADDKLVAVLYHTPETYLNAIVYGHDKLENAYSIKRALECIPVDFIRFSEE